MEPLHCSFSQAGINIHESSLAHQRCWGRNPCPGRRAPGSHVALQPLLRPHPSPAPPGQRNGGGAGPAGQVWGTARTRSGPLSSAAVGVRAMNPRQLQGFRHRRFRAATPMSGSDLPPPCPAMVASRVSRKQRGRRRGGQCRRTSQ